MGPQRPIGWTSVSWPPRPCSVGKHVAVIISEQLHTTVQLYLFWAAPEENRRGSWVLAQGRSHGSCHRNEISERDFHPKPRYPR